MPQILHISIYGAKTEAATSTTIASLERASFALSFDTNNSIFSFCVEMYLFPEQVTYVYHQGCTQGGFRGFRKPPLTVRVVIVSYICRRYEGTGVFSRLH